MYRLAYLIAFSYLVGSVAVKVENVTVETIEDGIGYGYVYVSFSSQENIIGFQFSIFTDQSFEAQFNTDTINWEFSTGTHELTYFEQDMSSVAHVNNFTVFGSHEGMVVGLPLDHLDLNAYDPISGNSGDSCEGLSPDDCNSATDCNWNINEFCEPNSYLPLLKIPWSINPAGFGYVNIENPKFIKEGGNGIPPQDVHEFVPEAYEVDENEFLSLINAEIPENYELGKAYPNPFNPVTRISYALPEPGSVKISIYDLTGRLVNELVDSYRSAGVYSVVWNGDDLSGVPVATGAYIYQMIAGQFVKSEKVILMK